MEGVSSCWIRSSGSVCTVQTYKSTLKPKTVSLDNKPKFIELDIPESLKDMVHAIDTYEGSDYVNVWTMDIPVKDLNKFANGLSELEGFDPETSSISGLVTIYK